MVRGLLLGSASALALSALFLVSASLLVPSPDRGPSRPVLRDQAEAAPRIPAVPERIVAAPPPETPAPIAEVAPQVEVRPQVEVSPAVPVVDAVDLPARSQFNRPPEDRTADTPETDAQPRPAATAEAMRPGVVPSDAPLRQTESATRPEPMSVDALSAPPEAGSAPDLPTSLDAAAPRSGTSNAAPDRVMQAPDDAPDEIVAQVEVPTVVPEEERVIPPRATDPAPEPIPEPAAEEPAPFTGTPRRLILDSERAAAEETEVEVEPEPSVRLPALKAQAAPFDNPRNLPMMAILLIDDPDAGVDQGDLEALDIPMTFAIDPTRPDARKAAQAYRKAGHEVVMLASALAPQGSAQDVEVAMSGAVVALPEALGVLDRDGAGFAANREALRALLPALAEQGMAFVAYPSGLNSGVSAAQREGVPAVTIYRALDQDDERAVVITRYLNRATFEAAQDGAVVVVGHTTPEMVRALSDWQDGGRAEGVAAAPLSAVLQMTETSN
ncbi:polysaccharide deacteylase family 2 protein [Jannaschia rubra]|uniref:Divergent polysaccharide deacetylase n=1 Tax=Jannaschia rubra TaxID=282197 RepID=A0A0M6XRY2_9RHOB|nr:polysaccharide deacteylase family 2 protein [Jannaschia rubra]CTQ32983.1 Divergent polysaccharide deacetylase [Jannaschia rubra]SFG59504.1 hypothetical protein SAMN04488517_10771 [Jannaschia rubra]